MFFFSSLMGKSDGGTTRSCKKQSNIASISKVDASLVATFAAASSRAWLGLVVLAARFVQIWANDQMWSKDQSAMCHGLFRNSGFDF
jgi:hypothetical protein